MKKRIAVLGALLLCGLPGCVEVSDIQVNAPEAVEASPAGLVEAPAGEAGMSAERLNRVTALTQRYVDEDKLAGVVTLVARDGKIVHFEAVGQRGADDDRPMTKDALFRIFSMSKPITAVAAMMLYEEGKFALSDPVEKFVPELADLDVLVEGELVPAERTMTMRHLLTHTTGLSYGFNPQDPVDQKYREVQPLAGEDLDEFAERLGTLPLAFEPGERWHYSVAVDVTGLVVERLSGLSFDVFLKERLFDPLGMEDTFFNVPADKLYRLLPNHAWNREEERLVQFDAPYEETQMFSGGGGLVSSTMDYLRFSEMVRRGGELDGVRILSPKTVEFMTANHLPSTVSGAGSGENPLSGAETRGFGFGLGFGVNTNPVGSGTLGSLGEYSWGGAAGTVFWVDPVEEMVVIGMIQLMGSPWPLRGELKVLANQAITESHSS
ncbi:MAG: beta-lactamase family protein [Gammaproteobacteria bacterium]|nr:beta-lactamase family protein [Gammaproteobacteria bacterium]MYF29470.1 beta-lactamase family protein [Gammaproteobacteria bacterium]MYK45993.1 beta-lactamase family protein [Gammaproteobacteria bacterium]